MKVLFISSGSSNAGSAYSLVKLATILKKNYGIDITIVLGRKGPIEELLKKNRIKYYIIKHYTWTKRKSDGGPFVNLSKQLGKRVINYLGEKKLDGLINKDYPDIIHINTVTTGFGAKTALKNNIKLIWHIREFMDSDLNVEFIDSKNSIKLINHSDFIIAISESIKKHFSSILDSSKMVRVYNGIDEESYQNKNNELFSNDEIILTIAGRLTEPKGQADAIKATKFLVDKGYNIKLQIAGSGEKEYENQLKSLVASNNIELNVEFLGFTSDIHNLWANTDIALVCSKAEAFGRVTVEAMMGGAIVIGANTEGTAELIDNKYGYIYKQGDADNLSQVIEYAINHKEEAHQRAVTAKEYALRQLTADKNAEHIYKLYKKTLRN